MCPVDVATCSKEDVSFCKFECIYRELWSEKDIFPELASTCVKEKLKFMKEYLNILATADQNETNALSIFVQMVRIKEVRNR